jgi:UDP-N-acetylglucosamine--N-acetylmuramyl-(pentapeptide) pyrophosphoryl-undecaprenol N-acetylglucosamine transferase
LNLVVTGGGTGGHVYPALETALAATGAGWSVTYVGSLRGIEGPRAESAGLPFAGLDVDPVMSLASLRGWKAAVKMFRAVRRAADLLGSLRPDAVFSTGGYASAPVVHAARKLRIPFWLHEQNVVPGRTNRILSKDAQAVCTVFESSRSWFPGHKVVRTGMPIRRELRESAQGRLPLGQGLSSASPVVLVMGGSQGSAALNDVALATAVRMASTEVQWLHVTGPRHYESTVESLRKLAVRSDYAVRSYLEAEEMATALFACSVTVCRAGAGTLAELAAFRKPSVLVPYPHAFADHQTANAREFARMGAAETLPQSELVAASLEVRIRAWLNDPARLEQAERSLAAWDVPDSTDRILGLLGGAPVRSVASIGLRR